MNVDLEKMNVDLVSGFGFVVMCAAICYVALGGNIIEKFMSRKNDNVPGSNITVEEDDQIIWSDSC